MLPPLSAHLACSYQFAISGKCSLGVSVLQEYSSCLERWQASWLDTKITFWSCRFTAEHQDTLEAWRCWRFLSVCFLASSPLFHSPAGMALSQTFFGLFAHVLFIVHLIVCAQACACSVRLSPLRMETSHLPVDVCGGQHITGALFEMSLYKWGNHGLPGPASGDHWQLACHQDTALVALDLYNKTKSFLNEESWWFLELFI